MITVTRPDGTPLELEDGATGLDAATAIGPRLAEASVAIVVDDAQSLYEEVRQTSARPTRPEQQPWGHLVFSVEDLDGNHLSFGAPLG